MPEGSWRHPILGIIGLDGLHECRVHGRRVVGGGGGLLGGQGWSNGTDTGKRDGQREE
jgi:hypothetical protein